MTIGFISVLISLVIGILFNYVGRNKLRLVRGEFIYREIMSMLGPLGILGFSNLRIIFKHILPNVIAPVVVVSCKFATLLLIEAGLSFLGIGTQPPVPSWGMIKDHYNYIIMDKKNI